jgi:hypothetical protein
VRSSLSVGSVVGSLVVGAIVGSILSCANGSPPATESPDAARASHLDAPAHLDAACVLGTPADCSACGSACPVVGSPAGNAATCSFSVCGTECSGDYYDMDGDLTNGCEAQDLPRQDTAALAVPITLPNTTGGNAACNGTTNPCTVTGQIFSDTSVHDTAPAMRIDGLPDWYVVTATGAGAAGPMTACLNIGNYPANCNYMVCISAAGSMSPLTCGQATGSGGASACVIPPGNPDAGTFYISVQKLAGTPTQLGYALYLAH